MSDSRFLIRAPRDDDELRAWGVFCATRGFGHRPGDPMRFYDKYAVDCHRRKDWVVVGEDTSTGAFVSSARVFDRTIDAYGDLPMVGLGEVCSDSAFRGQGLAGRTISQALNIMEKESGAVLSFLHAATGVQGMYEKFGYRQLRNPHGIWYIDTSLVKDDLRDNVYMWKDFRIRRVNYAVDYPQLMELHKQTVKALDVIGYTKRSAEYWQFFMPFVTKNHSWLAERDVRNSDGTISRLVVAQISAIWKNGKLRLSDFGVRTGENGATPELLKMLAAVAFKFDWSLEYPSALSAYKEALARSASSSPGNVNEANKLSETAPNVMYAHMKFIHYISDSPEIAESFRDPEELDLGWMVRPISSAGRKAEDALNNIVEASNNERFLVFAADSF